jgi:toxin-antitoxin system PIN domain toxin
MAQVSLLDVNLLVALFDPDHVHHDVAHDWFADEGRAGWATCAVTETGLLRVLSRPEYGAEIRRPADVIPLLRKFCKSGGHQFWEESVSLRDDQLFEPTLIRGHAQLTDIYLLGMARRHRGRLATFDRTIPVSAVKGAKRDLLQVITVASD